jgi:hypothetical protein
MKTIAPLAIALMAANPLFSFPDRLSSVVSV